MKATYLCATLLPFLGGQVAAANSANDDRLRRLHVVISGEETIIKYRTDYDMPLNLYNITGWLQLLPNLHICDEKFVKSYAMNAMSKEGLTSEQQTTYRQLMLKEGYIHFPPYDFALSFHAMRQVIDVLQAHALPLIFVFLFDEFWLLFYRMHPILAALFPHGEYYRLPAFWAWRIDPMKEEKGWSLHRDKDGVSMTPCTLLYCGIMSSPMTSTNLVLVNSVIGSVV